MISNLLPAALFVVFCAFALRAARAAGEQDRLIAARHFVTYALLVGLLVGLSHREMWPFSRWLVFAYKDIPHSTLMLSAIDTSGTEHQIDARALEPFNPVELYTWLSVDFPKLNPAQQQEAAGYLLKLANEGRQRALRGEPVGLFGRHFGNAAAPTHFLFTRKWDSNRTFGESAFIRLRIYRVSWEIHKRPVVYQRELLYESESR